MRPSPSFLLTLQLALLGSGCVASVEPPDEAAESGLAGTTASPRADFRTVESVVVRLRGRDLDAPGELVFVKVSLDPDRVSSLFLGRVEPGEARELRVAVPRGTRRVYYEVYDETGFARTGEESL